MGLSTQATDWQVCGVIQGAAAVAVGGGVYVFDFYSQTADICGRFMLIGGGIGVGGNASGTALPLAGFSPWTSIEVSNAFSLSELNHCVGSIQSLSIGVAVQYGAAFISAQPMWSRQPYFDKQNVGGFGTGLGAGGVMFVGGWNFRGVSGNLPSNATQYLA
jgi:hypothetical protein